MVAGSLSALLAITCCLWEEGVREKLLQIAYVNVRRSIRMPDCGRGVWKVCHETDDAKHNLARDGNILRLRLFLQLGIAMLRAILCLMSALSMRRFSSVLLVWDEVTKFSWMLCWQTELRVFFMGLFLRCMEESRATASIKTRETVNKNKWLTLLL